MTVHKVRELVRRGLVPCIVGCWGYYATVFGVRKMKRHWRNIVALWGAYPVIWCLAGEAGELLARNCVRTPLLVPPKYLYS